ncbi:uncharacterized protein LOC131227688 isoform X1 [Magnolia sinica]|uniref:uncharacterized protein LOC131227688 isoform X1 n=1 Tax=Magnolia sinica TaxID=86752 RepID=UPI002657F903|nr:uncharacterized protein LOC131227688 isoform X1 [Magnolia sinica]
MYLGDEKKGIGKLHLSVSFFIYTRNVIYHPEYGHSMSNLIIQNILVDRLFNVYVHSFLSSKIHVARIWQLWSQILNQQNYYKWKTLT